MSKKHGNRYSQEFKQEAVRLLLISGKTAKQLGQELGVTGQTFLRFFAIFCNFLRAHPRASHRCPRNGKAARHLRGGDFALDSGLRISHPTNSNLS